MVQRTHPQDTFAVGEFEIRDLHDYGKRFGDENSRRPASSSSISPLRMATPASSAPSASEPVSPMKSLAG